jgi:RimJ/RimL family protein N-acetyltransferase
MTRLSTRRLTLEPVDEGNAATLWRVMQSAHLREFQDVPRLTRDDFVRRVEARPRRFDGRAVGRFEWLIFLRAGGGAIGWVSLRVGESAPGAAEIGYTLLADARGKGYAGEAARALVDTAFATGLAQVDACCLPANTPSRRLLEAIGFTHVRLQRSGAVVRGRPVDICVYRLAREAWLVARDGGALAMGRQRSGS